MGLNMEYSNSNGLEEKRSLFTILNRQNGSIGGSSFKYLQQCDQQSNNSMSTISNRLRTKFERGYDKMQEKIEQQRLKNALNKQEQDSISAIIKLKERELADLSKKKKSLQILIEENEISDSKIANEFEENNNCGLIQSPHQAKILENRFKNVSK